MPQAHYIRFKIVDITYDDRPKLFYYYQDRRAKHGREREKIGQEQTKIIFLLLQLHNRLIDCIDSGNLSFCRLLDAIWPTCKEYNQHLADLAVGNYNCGTNKITRAFPESSPTRF